MGDSDRHPNVVHLDDVEAMTQEKGTRFGLTCKRLGSATGAAGVGCSWYEIPPGRAAFPRHYHCTTEEAVFVLEGEGTVEIGDDAIPVRAGSYMTFPVGPDHAHKLVNTGTEPLRYLCLSNQQSADVVGYPDSDKIAALASAPGSNWTERWITRWFPAGAAVDYYDGEDTGE